MKHIFIFFSLGLCVISSNGLTAQDDANFQDLLNKTFSYKLFVKDTKNLKLVYPDLEPKIFPQTLKFFKLLHRLNSEIDRQRNLGGNFSLGFNTDQAGEPRSESLEDLIKISSRLNLKRGSYPAELGFSSTLDLTMTNGTLTENLSDLTFSYDYYLKDRLESYLYLSRFSDKFMGVDNRYEASMGLVLEGGIRPVDRYEKEVTDTKAGFKTLNHNSFAILKELEPDSILIASSIDSLLKGSHDSIGRSLIKERIVEEKKNNIKAVYREYRKFRYALLLGISGESEKNSISEKARVPLYDPQMSRMDSTDITLTQEIPAEFKWRLVLRPTIDWNSKAFSLHVRPYFKLPLWPFESKIRKTIKPQSSDGGSNLDPIILEKYDWRFDGIIALTIGHGPTKASFTYRYLYDNYSPVAFIDPSGIDPPTYRNASPILVEEKKDHHIFRLSFQYSFQ